MLANTGTSRCRSHTQLISNLSLVNNLILHLLNQPLHLHLEVVLHWATTVHYLSAFVSFSLPSPHDLVISFQPLHLFQAQFLHFLFLLQPLVLFLPHWPNKRGGYELLYSSFKVKQVKFKVKF